MPLDDMLDDREAKAGPARSAAAARIGPVEAAGEVRDVLGIDAIAPVLYGQDNHVTLAMLHGHGHIFVRAAVFHGIVDKVADQLFQLLAIAAHQHLAFGQDEVEPIQAVGPGAIAGRLHGQQDEVDFLAGLIVLFRLDPRERHQIVDQRLQAPRLAQDGSVELARLFGRQNLCFVLQRFHIADDRGQRRAQFVAGIGDEIGMGTADVRLRCAVDQLDQAIALVDGLAGHLPVASWAGQPLNGDAAATAPGEQVDRDRMAKGDARILPDYMAADRLARGGIGDDDAIAVEHQHWQPGMFDQVAHSRARQLNAVRSLYTRGRGRGHDQPEGYAPDQHDHCHQPRVRSGKQRNHAGHQRQRNSCIWDRSELHRPALTGKYDVCHPERHRKWG